MVRKLITAIVILLQAKTNESRLLYKEAKLNTGLIDCWINIITHYLSFSFKIAIQNSDEYEILTSEMIKNLVVPVVLNTEEQHQWKGLDKRRMANIAMILDDDPNPAKILRNILWNADTRFLLTLKNVTKLPAVLQEFWFNKIVHVYVFIEENRNISVYSFDPYKYPECDSIEIKMIDVWINGRFTTGEIFTIVNETRIENFRGCPVNISVVNVKPNVMFKDECGCNGTRNIDGIEGKVVKEIAKKLNMNATYVLSRDGIGWGWIRPSPAGVVGDVYLEKSDLAFGLLGATLERFETLDVTVPYNGDECITYGVPRGSARKRLDWLNLLISEFPYKTWICTIAAYILTSITLRVLIKKTKDSLPQIPFYVFGLALGIPSKSPGNFLVRILYIFWVWCCLILTVAYQASMGSKLTVKKPDPDINTFKELLLSKLKLTGYNNMLRLMQYENNDGEIRDMTNKFVVTNFDIDEAVDRIAEQREIAHVRHTTTFLYYALINPKAKGEIHLVKDCIYHYYPIFVMKKYSPLLKRINSIMSNLKESGIVQYWRSKYIWPLPKYPEDFVRLSTEHMKGLFYIVLIGEAVAIASVILEIFYDAFRRIEIWNGVKKIWLASRLKLKALSNSVLRVWIERENSSTIPR